MKHKIQNTKYYLRKQRRLFVLAFTLPIVVILGITLFFSLRYASQTQAVWLNDSWTYRKKVPVTAHTPSAETDKYFSVTIDTSDTTRFQADCGDMRFTDATGKVLQYYIASGCSSASTVTHVLVPSFPLGATDYYLYYGNPTATNGFASADFSAATGVTVGSIGSEEKGTGPIAYWSFDQGTDNTCTGGTNDVCDNTQNHNDGASSSTPVWQSEDKCLSGKCMWFDGTASIVTVTNASAIDLDASAGLSGGFTFEAWIRPNGAGEGTGGQIFFKGTNTWFKVTNLSSGLLDLSASVDLATTDATLTVSAKVTDNRWTHVALSYTDDADDEITIWVNGVAVGTSTNGVGSLAADTNNLVIGGTTTNNFKGFIDEFKIYNFEKSATQMLASYNSPGSNDAVAVANGNTSQRYLSDGLVGYWNVDTNSGTTATDNSGNVNNGTLTSGPTWVGGKYGTGVNFDGTNDYITIPDSNSLDTQTSFTYSAWVYLNSVTSGCTTTTGSILNKGRDATTTYTIALEQVGTGCDPNGGNFAFKLYNGSTNPIVQGTSAASTATWYHVVGTYDGTAIRIYLNGKLEASTATTIALTAQTSTVAIGRNSNNTDRLLSGIVDEARIYNRALTPTEVKQLYSWSPGPTAWWKMDEHAGTLVADSSGNSLDATMSGMSWITGKYGSGLQQSNTGAQVAGLADANAFDINATESFTISSWVQIYDDTTFSNPQPVFSHGDADNTGQNGFSLLVRCTSGGCAGAANGGTMVGLRMADGTHAYSMTTDTDMNLDPNGTWHHIEAVVDRTSETKTLIYIDGVAQPMTRNGTFATLGSLASTAVECIGDGSGCSGSQFLGLDDMRFYTYARSPSQVLEDMYAGSVPRRVSTGSSLIYWPLDETYGTTVNNTGAGGSTYFGSISGPTWLTSSSCKVSSCLSFSASTDTVSATVGTQLDALTSFSTSMWLNPQSLGAPRMIVSKANTSTFRSFQILEDSSNSNSEIKVMIASSASDTSNYCITSGFGLATSTWQHLSVVYDGSQATGNNNRIKVYKNGKPISCAVTGTIPTALTTTTSTFKIGRGDDSTPASFVGYIDEFKFYIYALSSDQIPQDYNAGSITNYGVGSNESTQIVDGAGNPPTLYENFDTPNSNSNTVGAGNGTPLYWWKFDTGSGTSATDSGSGGTNTGTLQGGASWLAGISGSSLSLDGVNGYVSTTTSIVNPQTFSISLWFKTTVASGHKIVAFEDVQTGQAGANYDRHIMMDTNGHIEAGWYTGTINTITSTAALNDGTWHNAVFTKGTNSAALYIDGVSQGTGTGAAQSYTGWWRVGSYSYSSWPNGTDGYYSGQVDEVKIYSTELSAGQAANEFSNTRSVYDTSGNGFSATTTNNVNQSLGKYGRALLLSASDAGLSVADNASLDFAAASNFTVSTFAKHSASVAAIQYLMSKADTTNGGYKLYMDATGHYCFAIDDDSAWTPDDSACSATDYSTDGLWHHVVGKKTGTTKIELFVDGKLAGSDATIAATGTLANTNALYIGSDRDGTSNMWVGSIDEFKVYNYGRTNAQIAYDFNRGAPIGWWQFDDCQSDVAKDASGNANNATLTYGGGTYTQVGTCNSGTSSDAWYGGASGKFNGGIAIDTTTDTIDVGDIAMYNFERTDPFSTSIWFKTSTLQSSTLFSKQESSGNFRGWNIQTDGVGKFYFQFPSVYSSNILEVRTTPNFTYNDSNWHNVTTTYDGSLTWAGIHIYYDGKDQPLTNDFSQSLSTTTQNTAHVFIGSRNGTAQKWSGFLDDARIYNYVLGADQVKKLMLGGSSINFGPSSGSP